MKKCFILTVVCLLNAATLLSTNCQARTTSSNHVQSRLLLVEKSGHRALFLPETHVGTPEQLDAYFQQIIVPAFRASSRLLIEHPDETQLNEEYRYRSCADVVQREASIDAELNAAVQAALPNTVWHDVPLLADPLRFGRFMRVNAVMESFFGSRRPAPARSVQNNPKQGELWTVLAGQSTHLMREAPRPYTSIDDAGSMFNAYCALAPDERTAMAKALIAMQARRDSGVQRYTSVQQFNRETNDIYRQCIEQINQTLSGQELRVSVSKLGCAGGFDTQFERYLLFQRNVGWMEQLPKVMASERLPFYAIGAAHFVDGPAGPGLISMLRAAGYTVSLIAPGAKGRATLAALPVSYEVPQAMQGASSRLRVLGGGCHHVPGNYMCAWGDDETMFVVSAISPSQESVTLCATRATPWGKESHCSTGDVPRPPQRNLDLAATKDAVAAP